MEHELKQAVKSRIKRQVMQHLTDSNDVPVPRAMVESEIKQLARQAGIQIDDDADGKALVGKAPALESEARRRVGLGLIVSQMISSNNIKLDRDRVNAYLQEVAATFEDRDAIVKMYQNSPRLMESIEASVLEDQLIDWLLGRAQVTDKVCSFDEVTEKVGQQPTTVSEEGSMS
jgi:trigger factor